MKETEARSKAEEEKAVLQERLSNLEKDYEKLTADNQKRREIVEKQQHRADRFQEEVMIKVIEATEAAKATLAVATNARRVTEKKVAKTPKTDSLTTTAKRTAGGTQVIGDIEGSEADE